MGPWLRVRPKDVFLIALPSTIYTTSTLTAGSIRTRLLPTVGTVAACIYLHFPASILGTEWSVFASPVSVTGRTCVSVSMHRGGADGQMPQITFTMMIVLTGWWLVPWWLVPWWLVRVSLSAIR